jgi:hypothetical protein
MILVKLGDRAFEAEFTACDLQALDEFAGAGEQDAPSVLDESKPDGCCKMRLAGARRSSGILPGIKTKCGFIIRFIRNVAKR